MNTKKMIHKGAATVALITILCFISGTVYAEIIGNEPLIAEVKSWIVYPGLLLFLPCMLLTVGSGVTMAKGSDNQYVSAKAKRMPLIGVNGIFILLPSAIYLNYLAQAGNFGWSFIVIQSVEVIFGTINVVLILLNMRDGFRVSRQRQLVKHI
ncbi:hypothetical protein ACSLBF_15625 [Pseudoalteromonas sp. T1lg65]|uniref:hypothetical protein n=1 Tax=Pseudoalteromonas sp. T1lg65 TaxID=2077101 RepID=UPI003F7AE3C6